MIQKTFPILILLILISVLVLSLFLDDDEPQRIEGSIMGTTYNVIVFSEYDNLEQSIYDSFNSVNLSMSTYLYDSLINKVIYSEEILNNKDSIIRTVHDNSKINRCETCGKIIDFSCKILP